MDTKTIDRIIKHVRRILDDEEFQSQQLFELIAAHDYNVDGDIHEDRECLASAEGRRSALTDLLHELVDLRNACSTVDLF